MHNYNYFKGLCTLLTVNSHDNKLKESHITSGDLETVNR